MRPHQNMHPLALFFHSRKFTIVEGMNWLQDKGHISDNCVWPENVAACDVDAVLRRAGNGAEQFIPPDRRKTL